MQREKHILNITEQAKEGNIEAINILIENNSKMINKFAELAYEEIKIKYQLYYDLDEEILPNNIIDKDDVIQEFYIKSLLYLDKYLQSDPNIYFSSFLGSYLGKFKPFYVKKTLKKLIKQNDYEIIETIDIGVYNYKEQKQKQNMINYIMSIIEVDKKLMLYEPFIKDILSGLSYEELCEIYKLPKNRINMKLKSFCEIFKKHEELNLALLDSINEEYVLDKILNNQIEEITYYRYLIDESINKIHNENRDIPIEYIKEYLSESILKLIDKYMSNNDFNLKEFNKLFICKLRKKEDLYKRGCVSKKYIKKLVDNIKSTKNNLNKK